MDIYDKIGQIKGELSRRQIPVADVFGSDENEIDIHGQNGEHARGPFEQILEVVQKATDNESLWEELKTAKLIRSEQ